MYEIDETIEMYNVRSCRVCLNSKSENFIPLDEENGWLQLFEYCFDLALSSQDEPRVLCKQCASNVKKYSDFKKQCYTSDKVWKSLKNVKCTAVKIGLNDIDELVEPEQNIKEDDNDNKLNENDLDIYNNDNSVGNVCNDETKNVAYRNENSLDIIQCDIKDSIKILHESKEDEICIPEINKRDNSNENSIIKVRETLTCERCQKSYASQLWYHRHIKLCNGEKQELNPFAYNSGTNVTSYDSMEISKSNEKKLQQQLIVLYFCGVCKYSSDVKEDVNKHLGEHWNNKDLHCRLCDYIGKDQAALAAHRYVHSTVKITSFCCHICHKKTKSLLTLQFHYRKVHLNKSGGLCSQPQCDKVYNSWRLWKSHEKLHNHPGYVCDICGQKYRHRHLIIEHLINHTNPPSHVCDVCGKTFLRLRNLRVHIENVHSKPDPIKCNHCNRMFKNQHYLRVHQRREAMDKVWKCEFCPMEYPMLSALTVHMRSHSDKRPYCCHVCGSRYKGKGQLIVHMRNHTGCRPFKCVQCAKAFTSSAQLKTHCIIHTGILPYKCTHCDKSFRCKKRLMKHCTFSHKALVNEK